jgi:predicted ester cyclase
MTLQENKALVERFIDEILNKGNTAAIADFCVPGSIFAGGLAGQIQAMKLSFPNNYLTIEDIVAEGDRVAVRGTITGTNSGPLVGLPAFGRLENPVPPTGRAIVANAMYLFTIADGRIRSYAAELDQIGLLRQLGWTFTPPAGS